MSSSPRGLTSRWLFAAAVAVALLLGLAIGLLLRSDPFTHITPQGDDLQSKIDSALDQVEARYPHVELDIRGLSAQGIIVNTGWTKPDGDHPDFAREIRDRAEDQREATVAFFQGLARAHESLEDFAAAEDRLLVPVWSRSQILEAGDPRQYRDFSTFSEFQFAARDLTGYFVIGGAVPRELQDR